jgi:hypothetical protein
MNKIILYTLVLLTFGCSTKEPQKKVVNIQKVKPITLDEQKANYLYHFAYDCIDKEFPNKLGQVLGDASYLKTPQELHPSFYGCFDWHSSVHGHWTLVKILKKFPKFKAHDEILLKLKTSLTKANILKEITYFDDKFNKNYERTYGWAWLLKLSKSLKEWEHPEAQKLSENLQPLTDLISQKFTEFLNKLNHPIRVGEHPNTAFGMSFAYDYAKKYDTKLAILIVKKAKEFYGNDQECPLTWEPGGFDFLSPCLEEANLMSKVLSKAEFKVWFEAFLPQFSEHPSQFLKVAKVADHSDGKMAHLDGLNFSRAWCLYHISEVLDNNKMRTLANQHVNFSYSKMDTNEYAGAHWLASFALHAIIDK